MYEVERGAGNIEYVTHDGAIMKSTILRDGDNTAANTQIRLVYNTAVLGTRFSMIINLKNVSTNNQECMHSIWFNDEKIC